MYEDWKVAKPNEQNRKKTTWREFVDKIQKYYKLAENLTLKIHQFRTLTQGTSETFPAFCNFKFEHEDCTAESTAIRDQIIIGTINVKIREKALKNAWDLLYPAEYSNQRSRFPSHYLHIHYSDIRIP